MCVYNYYTLCEMQSLVSYSTLVLCSRDLEGLGFSAQKYHPKTSHTFPLQQLASIG